VAATRPNTTRTACLSNEQDSEPTLEQANKFPRGEQGGNTGCKCGTTLGAEGCDLLSVGCDRVGNCSGWAICCGKSSYSRTVQAQKGMYLPQVSESHSPPSHLVSEASGN
jgi:hypothetical protein